ncbi:hypothetical protein ACFP2F_11155 [Hymenobacter artigasi]|uniref:Uncharacterized protein n=1 Tax=Hymenobacter artigasi TaxID=2719616 RepID=A0ABX1HIS6_9BACT|nr:hypothetical protein [Hymenobacter artigasi]NKI90168.1 hypothetical protein [Hymenobacter artigasi]
MFSSQALDLPVTHNPITSSLYKSRSEEMAVAGPGPQWLGDMLRTLPAGGCYIDLEKLPALFLTRTPSAPCEASVAHQPAEHFQLTSDSPVVAGVAATMFQGSRPLAGIEYDVLSDLVDELALAQTHSLIPGMR